jgi:hypothetical protein
MWGSAIIGFGSYHYKYESGREGDAPLVGFSPRKNELRFTFLTLNRRKNYLKNLANIKQPKLVFI